MIRRFEFYRNAVQEARVMATKTGLDMAVRRVKEYGRDGYNVSFASRNDSDYARAEIVKPGEPLS